MDTNPFRSEKMVLESRCFGQAMQTQANDAKTGGGMKAEGTTMNLQVDRDGTAGVGLQVDVEHFQRDVVIIQFVITQGDVDIQGEVVPILKQDALVDVSGFLWQRSTIS